jgi:hypothetical protein
MTKLEFLPEPNMIFRLGNLSLIYAACFSIEFSQALLKPYERFVMLLKSRSRTHHSHMHCTYTRGKHKYMPFHQYPPKNIFYSYCVNTHLMRSLNPNAFCSF